jgi:hypothetical protein
MSCGFGILHISWEMICRVGLGPMPSGTVGQMFRSHENACWLSIHRFGVTLFTPESAFSWAAQAHAAAAADI